MTYPGISASPEDLERWLDATVQQRKGCGRVAHRWKKVDSTTPSGRTLYECLNCGRLSSGAEKSCHPLVGDAGKWR